MKKFAALLCMIMIFTGCSAGYIKESTGDAISPVQESTDSLTSSPMPLYFRYYTEPMLVRCSMNIDISPQQIPEYFAVSALISGVPGERREAKQCFGKNTTLVSVSAGKDVLYVTLSDGFLTDTKSETDEKTRENRRIALYSIVNTVCEMGNFSGVQFYICNVKTSLRSRPDSFEMGLVDSEAQSTTLGAVTRNTSLILTPPNVAKQALTHYSNTDWEKLYWYLGSDDTLPLQEEMAEKFNYLNLVMSEFSVEDNYTVSESGKRAMVQVSFKIRSESKAYSVTNIPIELIYKNGGWLVDYSCFIRYLGVEN